MQLDAEFSTAELTGSRFIMSNVVAYGDHLRQLSGDLQSPEWRPQFQNARQATQWDWWGNAVYVRGEGELVHLSYSKKHMDVDGTLATITSAQLDAVLGDFFLFLETGEPTGGTYLEDGTRTASTDCGGELN